MLMKNNRKTWCAFSIGYIVLLLLFKWIKPWEPSVTYPFGIPNNYWNPIIPADDFLFHLKSYLGNLVLFIPMGFLARSVIRKKASYWIFGVITCIVFELVQPIVHKGVFDLATVNLSLIGFAIGYVIYAQYKKRI